LLFLHLKLAFFRVPNPQQLIPGHHLDFTSSWLFTMAASLAQLCLLTPMSGCFHGHFCVPSPSGTSTLNASPGPHLRLSFSLFLFIMLLLYWGYIVTFTEVLTIYLS
jgi:hypothetical protein